VDALCGEIICSSLEDCRVGRKANIAAQPIVISYHGGAGNVAVVIRASARRQ